MKRILTQLRWPRAKPRGPVTTPLLVVDQSPETRLRHHAALVYLSSRVLRSASTSLLGDVCRIAARVLNADHVHVLELLPDGRTLIGRAAAGWPPERLARWQMDVSPETRLGEVLRTGGLMVLDRGTEAPGNEGSSELLHQIRMQSGLAAGLTAVGDTRGLFGVYSSKPRRFSRDDLQFVRAVAQIVESALHREAQSNTERASHAARLASQADLLRIVVGRLRPALRESVSHLWQFRTQPTDTFTFRRAVRQTERQVASVADFIEDLALLADLLDGRVPNRRNVLLAPILSSLVDQLTDRADSNNIALQLRVADDLIATGGDCALLRRALFNVVDNALRFTGPGGTIAITVKSPDPSATVIEITDTGRGMTATQVERLSTNLEGATESQDRGPGIGWRLASAIVQAHGGTLSATSRGPHMGTTISIKVPRLQVEDCNQPQLAE